VGVVSINRAITPEPSVSIDFGIAVSFWNRGYATAAVAEAITYAKNELKAKLYDGPRIDRFENRLLEIYRFDL
jgi:RimJ/RimL family protein N-acetyltransferase